MSISPLINQANLRFLLHEVFPVEKLCVYPRFAEHEVATFDAVIQAAHDLALNKFLPHNRKSDNQEPEFDQGRVKIIPEVKAALDAYAEAGFPAAFADSADGGMQLPFSISLACDAVFTSANVSTMGYAMLARGVANLLKAHGTVEQQEKFMRPILQGRFLGTMCLSEPQAGSSLGDIKTTATAHADGSYRVNGSKMWISGGEHDLSENIIHMVLAKVPGGPAGVKGISLFIVPKFLVNADGRLGARNDVQLAGVNHKLGQRGIVNTFLKFGEQENCVGYLVGAMHQGLSQMFHMMNEARIGVGVGAIMLGTAGYLHSLEYAKERKQGRHPEQKDPASPPVALIEHADVRRMLLQQKAYTEGALALAFYSAQLVDVRDNDSDKSKTREAALLLDLITPILKAWSGEWCCKANDLAIQILGGYGYTREYPVEQYYRDNRLNPIHEGANGIQALDLLGRKVVMENGAALQLLQREIQNDIAQAGKIESLKPYADQLSEALLLVGKTTQVLTMQMQAGHIRLSLANAAYYLNMMGHISIAWMWLKQAIVAARSTESGQDFYQGKLHTCRFFFTYELPQIKAQAALLQKMDDTTLTMPVEAF
jgi:alkylation response protein AidB-like acyl-CoA dehydrogenase